MPISSVTPTKKNKRSGLKSQGVSRGVDGAVLATLAVIGSESSPTPPGTSSFVQGAGSWNLPGTAAGGGGGTEGGSGGEAPRYKDPIASVFPAHFFGDFERPCPQWYITGFDENGHRYGKTLICGFEWCPQCGENWSTAHKRRFARWLPKGMQMNAMGYLVIEWPKASRHKLRFNHCIEGAKDKDGKPVYETELARAGKTIKAVLSGDWEVAGYRLRVKELRSEAKDLKELARENTLAAREKSLEAREKTRAVCKELRGEAKEFREIAKDLRLQAKATSRLATALIPDKAEIKEIKAKWFEAGLRRWHYFGDIKLELERDLKCLKWQMGEFSDDYSGYNPHQNVLIPYGYIVPGKLDRIKKTLKIALGEPDLIVHYGYTREASKMVHLLKYVTRATFRDWEWDPIMAAHIHGLQNALSWGKWDKPASWSLEDLKSDTRAELEDDDFKAIESLGSGICPRVIGYDNLGKAIRCGLPLEWGKPIPIEYLEAERGKRSLGAGYYQLADMRSPPVRDKYHPAYPLLGYLTNIKHCRLEAAKKRAEAEAVIETEEYQGWWDSLLHTN